MQAEATTNLVIHNPAPIRQLRIGGRSLTRREQEIVTLMIRGTANRRIAEMLGISENTMKTQLGRLYTKVGVRTRLELVTKVLRR